MIKVLAELHTMKISDLPVKTLALGDKNYPEILRKIKSPPKRIYYRGRWDSGLFDKSIAVVGSRKVTRYGAGVTEKFVAHLVANGVTIVSGFMYGVDTLAHKCCVELGGRTVAVFGCGLNVIYPPENEPLYGKILETGGLALSEYEALARPHLWKFPQRNRIVVGLSTLGVLVVEASMNSGSLVTARLAREQKKKVWAVPGPITSFTSQGTNWLIATKKAVMATTPEEITGGAKDSGKSYSEVNLFGLELVIFNALKREAMSVDELSKALGCGVVEISQTVSLLALKGTLIEVAGKYEVKI